MPKMFVKSKVDVPRVGQIMRHMGFGSRLAIVKKVSSERVKLQTFGRTYRGKVLNPKAPRAYYREWFHAGGSWRCDWWYPVDANLNHPYFKGE